MSLRISASPPSQEVIQLKRIKKGGWDGGGLEEYEDTPETILFREQMQAINAWLEAAEIDFDEDYRTGGSPVDTLGPQAATGIHPGQVRQRGAGCSVGSGSPWARKHAGRA